MGKLFGCFVVSLLANICYSQNSQILSGFVLDSLSQRTIPFATLRFKADWKLWNTNSEGEFEIKKNSDNQTDTLIIGATGYETTQVFVNRSQYGNSIKIVLRSMISLKDSSQLKISRALASTVFSKVISNFKKNYPDATTNYIASFQQVTHNMSRIYEQNDAEIIVYDKGFKRDNSTTRISLVQLSKFENLEYAQLKSTMLEIGGTYNHFYKVADCDFVRAFDSNNKYSKWSPGFFRPTSFEAYDMIIANEDSLTYTIVATLKEDFSNSTIMKSIQQVGSEQDINQVNSVTSNLLDFSFKIAESIRYTIQKESFAITKIEQKSHSPTFKTIMRNNYEVSYKFKDDKYYLDYIKTYSPLGKIGFRNASIYIYSELIIKKYLTDQEEKSFNKDFIDRDVEICKISSKVGNTVFKPLMPYF